MRKKQLSILLEEAENKIQHLLKEKEEVIAKLQKANEFIDNNDEISTKDATIDSLNHTINELKSELENKENEYAKKETELNATIEELNKQINDIKGELFDTNKLNDELKIRVEYLTEYAKISNSTEVSAEVAEEYPIRTTPPIIHKVESIEDAHKEAYEYGSKIISRAILKSSNVKNDIVNTAGPMSEELLTLSLGKLEMLKSGVLQIVLEETEYSEKTVKMDNLLKETYDYFDSLLGQIK